MREKYRPLQSLLWQQLMTTMPEGTTVSQPGGGLSLWLTLPVRADVSDLYFRAVRRGVSFIPGDLFYVSPSHPRSLRISFGYNHPEQIAEGVTRLSSVVTDLLTPRGRSNLMVM